MLSIDAARELLASQFDVVDAMPYPLMRSDEKSIFRVEHANGTAWALRSDPTAAETRVRDQSSILRFRESYPYPAPRLVRSRDGAVLVSCGDWRILVTTYVPGTTCDFAPEHLRQLGAAIGRLHALVATAGTPPDLPIAGMRPRNELAWALSRLRSVADRVPTHLMARYETIEAAVLAIDLCEDLPSVLIRNDCHPYNAISTPGDEVILIDWEGAGLAPAPIDAGFALHSCDRGTLLDPELPFEAARAEALLEGTCQHHQRTDGELNRLADMIRFRIIVYGACEFADAITDGRGGQDEASLWWRRYGAAEELATRAIACFERVRSRLG